MARLITVVLYVVAMAAVIVGVDLLFFRNRFWEFYWRFLWRPSLPANLPLIRSSIPSRWHAGSNDQYEQLNDAYSDHQHGKC
jgi:hypothetical protein